MKNNEQAATSNAENYLEFSESIKKMTSKQFDNFIWAMYQGNDYCAFGKGKWVEVDMWNYAQCIHDNHNLEDEEELNEAKDKVIRFFEGEYTYDYTDEEWDNFKKVTGEFLASYFEHEVAKQQAATLQKDIEKRIEKVANGGCTFNPELPNGWRLDLCSYEIDDTTYVDVMLIPDPGKDDKLYYTVKAGDQDSVRKAAEGAAKVVTF